MSSIGYKEVFVVNYYESESGWGDDTWDNHYGTEEEALRAVERCNKKLPTDHVPNYYIIAKYLGPKIVKTEE